MTRLRCFLFACCFAWGAGSFAQEHAAQLPDAPQAQKSEAPASGAASSVPHVRQRPLEGRKIRLTLLSPISSKSPSGSSFMAKLENPVEVEGKPALPQGTLVEGHLETIPARRMMRRGALRMVFDRVKLPDGTLQPARFELSSTESQSAKAEWVARPWLRNWRTIFPKKLWLPPPAAGDGMAWPRALHFFCCKKVAR
jgi:hypothetical protein